MQKLMERGLLGEKRGQGFYKRVGKGAEKEIYAIDLQTLEYHPAAKPKFPSVEATGKLDLHSRLRTVLAGDDPAGRFLWLLYRDFFWYAVQMAPEISDRVVEMDRAMRWGFAMQLGPFEVWDALGFRETADRMQREGCSLPIPVQRMLGSGANSFYEAADRERNPSTRYFDLQQGEYRELEPRPG